MNGSTNHNTCRQCNARAGTELAPKSVNSRDSVAGHMHMHMYVHITCIEGLAMEQSTYNEWYSLPHPCGCESRSTRYRAKKRVREQEEEHDDLEQYCVQDSTTQGGDPQTLYEDDNQSTTLGGDLQLLYEVDQQSTTVVASGIMDMSSNLQLPQLLDIEILGQEQSLSDSDSESGPETSSITVTSTVQSTAQTSTMVPHSGGKLPLFDGVPCTQSTSNVLIMQYKMRHRLTDEGLADLLQLLKLRCPTPNSCLPSIYYFKKQFSSITCPVQFHHYGSNCFQSIEEP